MEGLVGTAELGAPVIDVISGVAGEVCIVVVHWGPAVLFGDVVVFLWGPAVVSSGAVVVVPCDSDGVVVFPIAVTDTDPVVVFTPSAAIVVVSCVGVDAVVAACIVLVTVLTFIVSADAVVLSVLLLVAGSGVVVGAAVVFLFIVLDGGTLVEPSLLAVDATVVLVTMPLGDVVAATVTTDTAKTAMSSRRQKRHQDIMPNIFVLGDFLRRFFLF